MQNRKVFTAFLQTYLDLRSSKTWNTWLGWFASFVRDDASINTAHCIAQNKNFYDSPQFDLSQAKGWIDLFDELGRKAEKQYVHSGTLHAIRTYGIAKVTENRPEDLAHQKIRAEYLAYMDTLRKETNELYEQRLAMIIKKASSEEIAKLGETYHTKVKKLANLGDQRGIALAAHENIFTELECPKIQFNIQAFKKNKLEHMNDYVNSWNENIPWYYHDNWYLMCYDLYFRKFLSATFAEFEKQALSGNKVDLNVNNERKGLLSMLFTSASAAGASSSTSVVLLPPPTTAPPSPPSPKGSH